MKTTIYIALAVLLIIQIWAIVQQKNLPRKRLFMKLFLNGLLWLGVLLFVVQPQWTFSANTNRVLLTSENIPAKIIQKTKDSLQISEKFSITDFNKKVAENPDFLEKLGNVYLLGNDFNSLIISQLSDKNVNFLPFFKEDELQEIHWKGIVRKGDLQEISGKIALLETKKMSVKFGNQVLDSVLLQKGLNNFILHFPIFSIGKTETDLELADKSLQKINFYVQKKPPISIYFILKNPDFESKTLAEWLGKNGNHVEIITTVAKDAQSKISLNKTEKQKQFSPDIVITDPSNAGNAAVKKAVLEGKSVLFLNLADVENDLKNINQALGMKWRVKKISNEATVKINENLTALPFHFEENLTQKTLKDYPVTIQKTFSKIGISLLNETFPLKLSGDSLDYSKIWTNVFQQLNPAFSENMEVDAPIFKDLQTAILLNNFTENSSQLKISEDTIFTEKSAVNALSSTADFRFRKTGWQFLRDSTAFFVEENENSLAKAKQIEEFLKAKTKFSGTNSVGSAQTFTAKLPNWAWFLLLLLLFTAVWIEPKLQF